MQGSAVAMRLVDGDEGAEAAGAAGQDGDLVAEADGLGQVVGDVDGGGSGPVDQGGELVQQQGSGSARRARERLVHQQAGGADGQGPGDADALPHAAAESWLRPGLPANSVQPVRARTSATRSARALGRGEAAFERQGDVAGDGAPGQEGESPGTRG